MVAAVDYEVHYMSGRSYHTCDSPRDTEIYRIIVLWCSVLAIFSLIYRYFAKRKSERNFSSKISTLPVSLTLFDRMEPQKKQTFFTPERVADIIILLVMPYPYVDFPVHVPQRVPTQTDWETSYICYDGSEILYCLMFMRVWLLLRACFNYAVYQNDISKLYCRKLHISANRRFTFKCLMKRYPLCSLFGCILITFLCISVILRVFERPYVHMSDTDFAALNISAWCVIVSLSTIGYGDTVPHTSLGQMIISVTVVWGALIFSTSVLVFRNEILLNQRQELAYYMIRKAKKACKIIQLGYLYYADKKQHGAHARLTLVRYAKLRMEAKFFSDYRKKHSKSRKAADKNAPTVDQRLDRIEKLLLEVLATRD